MKRHLLTFVLAVICQLLWSQDNGKVRLAINDSSLLELYAESHALLIGISDYTNGWPDLKGVKKDIDLLKPALKKHGFNVTSVNDPTREELDKAIMDFIRKYAQTPDNRILIYFAGHGSTVPTSYGDDIGYIVPADAPDPSKDLAGFKTIAMPMSQIEIYAKQIDSKHALFLFDACFSGSLFSMTRAIPDAISYKTSFPVRQFITSGSANETVPDVSIFREEFISALTTNLADANKDGYLTGSELGEYLQTNVTNYSYNMQHPQYGKIRNAKLDKGDFVFLVQNDTTPPSARAITVPKVMRTKKLNDFIFEGIYFQGNLGFSELGINGKLSLFYSSKVLNNRYCVGVEANFFGGDYSQKIETFPNMSGVNDTVFYTFQSLNLYNRLYLFPQNQSKLNLYAALSLSLKNYQFEIGFRPFLTKSVMLELQSSYVMQQGSVQDTKFSQWGDSEIIVNKHLFKGLYFGVNFIYFTQI